MTASPPGREDLRLPLLAVPRNPDLRESHDSRDQYHDHEDRHDHEERLDASHADSSHSGPHADIWTPNGSPRSAQACPTPADSKP